MEHIKHFIRLSEEPQRFKALKEYQKEFSEPIPETSLRSFFLAGKLERRHVQELKAAVQGSQSCLESMGWRLKGIGPERWAEMN